MEMTDILIIIFFIVGGSELIIHQVKTSEKNILTQIEKLK